MALEFEGDREGLEAFKKLLKEEYGADSTLICSDGGDCRLVLLGADAAKFITSIDPLAEDIYGEKVLDNGRVKVYVKPARGKKVEVTLVFLDEHPAVYRHVFKVFKKSRGVRTRCRRGKCGIDLGGDVLLFLVAQSRKTSEAVFGKIVLEEPDFRVHLSEDGTPTFCLKRGDRWRPYLGEKMGDGFVVYGPREEVEEIWKRLRKYGLDVDAPRPV
ncbi:MAG: hypothetical protein ABWK05_03135 [Pyrobaculum sp.]